MPAARFWRLIGINTSLAGADLEISEIQLLSFGSRADAHGTLTASISPVAGSVAALSDGAASASCRFLAAGVRSPGFALTWDLGVAIDVNGVLLGAAASRDTYLDVCTLQSSQDGIAWATVDTLGRSQWPGAWALSSPMQLGDAYAALNQLVLHYDGGFTDSSSAGVAVVNNGVAIDAGARFGSGAGLYGGAAYLQVPTSVLVTSGDITIETQMKIVAAHDGALYSNFTGGGNGRSICYVLADRSLALYYDGNSFVATPAGVLTLGVYQHIRLVKKQGNPATFMIFVDGELLASAAAFQPVFGDSGSMVLIGHPGWRPDRLLQGYLDETVVTFGARSTSAFTPPSAPYGGGVSGVDPLQAPRAGAVDLRVAASAPLSAWGTTRFAAEMARDVEHGGAGRIFGTTKAKGAAGTPNLPTKSRVVLLHQRSKMPVREVWSDPITGAFVFEGIDTTQQFLTLAEDAAGNFRPVAASRLAPEVAA